MPKSKARKRASKRKHQQVATPPKGGAPSLRSLASLAPLPPLDPLQRYTLPEAMRYLRLSYVGLWKKRKAGQLAGIQDGGRVYIPGSEIIRLSSAA